ncbi:hypothetical protein LYNGBM3L_53010 [Moorena producens 3L]|uniref:Uncharacterized protein n=1 Tax=Moorena producens 3L TaxID=489825 RepID=F4XYV9_9CYAN|nr:hypothetical protein LYNGBM3L_53010 [Moorena producens 3L]
MGRNVSIGVGIDETWDRFSTPLNYQLVVQINCE